MDNRNNAKEPVFPAFMESSWWHDRRQHADLDLPGLPARGHAPPPRMRRAIVLRSWAIRRLSASHRKLLIHSRVAKARDVGSRRFACGRRFGVNQRRDHRTVEVRDHCPELSIRHMQGHARRSRSDIAELPAWQSRLTVPVNRPCGIGRGKPGSNGDGRCSLLSMMGKGIYGAGDCWSRLAGLA